MLKFMIKIPFILLLPLFSLHAQVTGLSGWNIFLDPGHSRTENMGIYGYSEAERNLGVGLQLREMLLNTTDIDTVYLSRTNHQQVVGLSQRSDYANRVGAAWFHSIHSDAGSPDYNSTLLLWGQYYDGREKIPNGGQAMSAIMVDLLTRGMRTTTRGSIGDCSFYTWSDWCKTSGGPYLSVNRRTTMPSELSEAGFHTNPRQNQLFMNAEWKKLEAKTFYWSILKFHEIEIPFAGTCVGIVSDVESRVPVNGAQLTINGESYTTDTFESLFHQYTSNPDLLHNGFYYFENLPDATLELTVQADGYYADTLQVTVVDSFFTFADIKLISKTPPHVLATTPAAGDTNFPAWDEIMIKFSRIMNRALVESTFAVNPPATGTFTWKKNDTELYFLGDSLAFLTEYVFTVSGQAQDVIGHNFDGNGDGVGGDDFSLQFTTGPADMSPPKVAKVFPPQNGTDIPLHSLIHITYDEQIDSTSVTGTSFRLERFADRSAVPGIWEHHVLNEQSVFCFFPDESLFADELYITRTYPGLVDLFGNKSTKWRSYSFKTTEASSRFTQIDDFENNPANYWWQPQQSGTTTGIITEKTSRSINHELVNHATGSTAALQLNYGWDISAGSQIIRVYLSGGAPRNVHFNAGYRLEAYVFGDGSGNKFRFALDDKVPASAAENHEVSPWYNIDWIGWRLVSWDMTNDSTGTWLGNGRLDGTLRFDSIQLTYTPGSVTTGTFYIDDLRLAKPNEADVANLPRAVPPEYALRQNYPNPFNPATTIIYQIPGNQEQVELTVFDLLGKKVRVLVNHRQSAGTYAVQWDGKDSRGKQVATGTYVYKLRAGNFSQSRTMILVK